MNLARISPGNVVLVYGIGTLAELKQAVELVSRGIVTMVIDRTLPLDEFQKGIHALARSEPVRRVVLLP